MLLNILDGLERRHEVGLGQAVLTDNPQGGAQNLAANKTGSE